MAFVKKTWKNRVSEFFNRYRVENVQTGAISKVYMNLDDGMVTQEGDVIDAATMNDLENRIENALADVGKGSNWVGTTEEWNALTDAEKAEYDTYDLTDDYSGTGIDVNPTSGSSNVVTSGGVANHLVVGERKFYFDYQDGKYGYNTSANRGADTFVPFSSGMNRISIATGKSSADSNTINIASILPDDYQDLTLDNFMAVNVKQAWSGGEGGSTYSPIPTSYDSSTGSLVCGTSRTFGGGYSFYFTYDIVCVY